MEKNKPIVYRKKQYTCNCGKIFPCYPAFYSHVKLIHNPSLQQVRPTQPKYISKLKSRDKPKYTQIDSKSIDVDITQNPIVIFNKKLSSNQFNKGRILEENLKNIIKNSENYLKLQKIADNIESNKINNSSDGVQSINTGNGIAKFIKQVKDIVSEPFATQIYLIIVVFIFHILDETDDPDILTTSELPFIIDFANDFLIKGHQLQLIKLYKGAKSIKLEDSSFEVNQNERSIQLSSKQQIWIGQKSNVIGVLNILFEWMVYKKYTTTKVLLNPSYKQ